MFSLPRTTSFHRRGGWLVILISLLALILAHWIAQIYRIHPAISLWFAPSGVAIALALWFGPIAVVLTAISSVLMAPLWGVDGWARLAGVTDALEPLIAWLLYRRFANGSLSFRRLRDAATFALCGPIAASATTAVVGCLTLVVLGEIPMSNLGSSIAYWWVGNAAGTMAIAPTALLVLTPLLQSKGWISYSKESPEATNSTLETTLQAQDFPAPCLRPRHYRAEVSGILLLSVCAAAVTVWHTSQGGFAFQQLSFLSFVPIIWAATRFGVTGGMLVSTFCVLVTLLDYLLIYPNALSFTRFPLSPEILHVHQLSLLVQCAVSLLVGCAATERAAIQVALAVEQVRAVEYRVQAQLSEQLMKLNQELTQANTQLEESHEQLYRREQEFKALVENSPDIITRFDRQLRHVYVNSAVEQETGLSPETFIGKTHQELWFTRQKSTAWQKNIQKVFDTGEEVTVEFNVPLSSGIRYYQSRLVPEFSQDGAIASVLAVTRNITDLKETETALRQSEARFRRLVDSNLIGVIFVDLKGKIADANQAFLQIVGYSWEELLEGEMSWLNMTPPEYVSQDEQVIAELKTSGVCKPFEKEYLRKDGSRVPVLLGAAVLEGSGEECVCFVLDLTERKQIEAEREKLLQQQQAQRELLEAILQQMPAGVMLAEAPSGKLVFGNQQTEKIFRHPFKYSARIEKYSEWKIYHADSRPYTVEEVPLARSINKGEVITEEEIAIQRGDGTWGIINVNSAPIKDWQGQTVAAVATFYDITDRKQASREREQLLAQKQRYVSQLQGLTSSAVAISSALSIDDVLKVITEQARSIIGAHQSVTSMTVNQNWAQSIHTVSLSDKYAQWQDYDRKPDGSGIYSLVCQTNSPVRMTQAELEAHPGWRKFDKEAEKHPPMRGWLAAPLRGRDGRNIGLIQLSDKYEGEFTSEDEAIVVQLAEMASVVIENVQLYEAEQAARTQAETANRIKDEFMAVLSHELRSPLNPILGWVKLLRTRKFDETTKARALETIERNTRLQSQLIDDLLDISRILRGKLSLNVTKVNLVSAIEAALEIMRLAAETKSINLKFSILDSAKQERLLVKGDPNRLQQIVWNLLSNAIKFTPERGRVEVKLEVGTGDWEQGERESGRAGERESGRIPYTLHPTPHTPHPTPYPQSPITKFAQIQVSDTGKGITPDFLPYVFEHFRQADSSITRKYGGLGLGLAIVRNLVELHGGTIKAESPGEGMGATFTVRLPLLKSPELPIQSSQKEDLNSELKTQDSKLLTGLRVLVVDDEADTRELIGFILEQHGAKPKMVTSAFEALEVLEEFQPDILVSDIGMPEQDGYRLLREVRSRDRTPSIPAIALTAYASDQDKKNALSAGYQLHLSKPVDTAELVRAIANLAKNSK